MPSRSFARDLLLLLAGALLLAACGGGDDEAKQPAAKAGGANGAPELGDEQQLDRPKLDLPLELGTAAVGPLRLGAGATLAAATKTFGAPDVQGPGDADPILCAATWAGIGLTLLFSAGDESPAGASCSNGTVVAGYVTSGDWVTKPGGMRVGEDETSITRAHERARRTKLPPAVIRTLGDEDGWLLEPGVRGPWLYAATEDRTVATLVLTNGQA